MRSRSHIAALLALAWLGCGGGEGEPDGGPPGPPDAAAPIDSIEPLTGSCNPVAQTGCPADRKCSLIPAETPDAPPMLGCVPATGSLGALDECAPATPTEPDQCAPGLVCRGIERPRCLEFCSQVPTDSCPGEQTCAVSIAIDDEDLVETFVCAPSCDPLAQDCLEIGYGCYPSRNGTACAPIGAGDTPVEEGEVCDYANSCEVGLGCFRLGAAFEFTCQKLCDPGGGEPSCKPAQTCNQVENEVWGICTDVL